MNRLPNYIYNLKELALADQTIRKEYKEDYLDKSNCWEEARDKWIKDKNPSSPKDIFGDTNRLKEARLLIETNINQILNNSKALTLAWILVQHMDDQISFQQYFLQKMKEKNFGEESSEFRFLTDRILVNSGEQQKYNTQKVF